MNILDKMTPRTRELLRQAMNEAAILGDAYVGTEHILLAMFSLKNGVALNVLERLFPEVTYDTVKAGVMQENGKIDNEKVESGGAGTGERDMVPPSPD